MTLDEGIIHAEDVARSNHEAATYLADEHPTQAEKCEECAREHEQLAEWLKELKAYRENTCGDAISRQAAIEAIEALQLPIMREASSCYQFKFSGMSEAKEAVVNLPSVTPQQRTGRWIQKEEEGDAEPFIIWECSECHCVDEDGKPSYKYCPQCGARMEVEE